jgi:hypothetical protein
MSSPLPCYLVPLRSKYPPQHHIHKKPSAYIPPSMLVTTFHNHVKQPARLQFCIS